MPQARQGIWMLIFPDRKNVGNPKKKKKKKIKIKKEFYTTNMENLEVLKI